MTEGVTRTPVPILDREALSFLLWAIVLAPRRTDPCPDVAQRPRDFLEALESEIGRLLEDGRLHIEGSQVADIYTVLAVLRERMERWEKKAKGT